MPIYFCKVTLPVTVVLFVLFNALIAMHLRALTVNSIGKSMKEARRDSAGLRSALIESERMVQDACTGFYSAGN